MAINVFGPGLIGDQATASRPIGIATGSGVDLWFQDCTSEEAQDGTRIRAQWLNFIAANFREAVRGLGVTENETDDDLLLKCFQKIMGNGWLNLPIYPEILQGGNVLSITESSGSLIIGAGQSFLHRGWNKVLTNDYTAGERTLAHFANKTYHVRWQYNNGAPLFVLKDTTDAAYNPGSLGEDNAAFDSAYDDMLIARVITNGSNVPTILQLKNAAALVAEAVYENQNPTNHGDNFSYTSYSFTLNWARTPGNAVVVPRIHVDWTYNNVKGSGYGDTDLYLTGGLLPYASWMGTEGLFGSHSTTWDRYSMVGRYMWDYAETLTLQMSARA